MRVIFPLTAAYVFVRVLLQQNLGQFVFRYITSKPFLGSGLVLFYRLAFFCNSFDLSNPAFDMRALVFQALKLQIVSCFSSKEIL